MSRTIFAMALIKVSRDATAERSLSARNTLLDAVIRSSRNEERFAIASQVTWRADQWTAFSLRPALALRDQSVQDEQQSEIKGRHQRQGRRDQQRHLHRLGQPAFFLQRDHFARLVESHRRGE